MWHHTINSWRREHYEYAVQNFDNHRGGATLRIPVCVTTPVTNVSFRDPNGNPLDDWTTSRVVAELVFSAPARNPLDWNCIYNFGRPASWASRSTRSSSCSTACSAAPT